MAFNPNEPRDAHGRWARGAIKRAVHEARRNSSLSTDRGMHASVLVHQARREHMGRQARDVFKSWPKGK